MLLNKIGSTNFLQRAALSTVDLGVQNFRDVLYHCRARDVFGEQAQQLNRVTTSVSLRARVGFYKGDTQNYSGNFEIK